MQDLPNVLAAMPFGDTHKVKILTSKPKSFTQQDVVEALDGTDFELKGFEYASRKVKKLKKSTKSN